MTLSLPHNAVEIGCLLWSTRAVRSWLGTGGPTKASRGTVTHRRLQGCRGSSERATRCVWSPPTHIPSVHPQRDPGTSWEVVRAGSQFLLKMTFNMSPPDLAGRRNGFFGVTECSAGRASPWLIFTAPLNVSAAHLWSHTTCLHPGFVASPHSLQMTACN